MRRWFKNNNAIAFFVLMFVFLTLGKLFAGVLPEPLKPAVPKLITPELNPDFVKWQEQQTAKKQAGKLYATPSGVNAGNMQRAGGYKPAPYDIGYLLKQARAKNGSTTPLKFFTPNLPAQYDLRDVSGQRYITQHVGNQNPLGVCWTFAATEAVQSNMLKQGLADDANSDLSQWNIAYGAYNNESDAAAGKVGFECFARSGVEQKPSPYYTGGGNNEIATALMSRGSAPVLESAAPYPYKHNIDPNGVLDPDPPVAPTSFTPIRGLKEANLLVYSPSEADRNKIKQAIMDKGAVSIGLTDWDDGALSTNNAYYDTTPGTGGDGGHAITIIGWDDNYAKTNFKTGAQPTSDGAWIAKNSWGTDWGDNGYFYISYDEQGFEHSAYTFVTEAANTDKIYQYDMFGHISEMGFGKVAHMANIFTAQENGQLKAVSFWALDDLDYEIKIYTGVTGNPDTGTLQHTQTGTATPGYHKITLSAPVAVTKNANFSVVIKVSCNSSNNPVALCKNVGNYVDKATGQTGKSWLSPDNSGSPYEWIDVTVGGLGGALPGDTTASVCIKAFVDESSSSTGYLKITTTDGGRWKIIGESNWRSSGDTASVTITSGTSVSKDVEFEGKSGFFTPSTKSYTINSGATTTDSITYIPKGSVKVKTDPATGKWKVTCSSPSYDSGWKTGEATVSDLEAGTYTVTFDTLTGYSTKPADQTITIVTAFDTTHTTNSYDLGTQSYSGATGTLQITLSGVTNGGWRLQGEGVWHNSGESVTVDITSGTSVSKTVEFKAVDNYLTPSSRSYTIGIGETKQETVTYNPDTVAGNFKALIDSAAVQGSNAIATIKGTISNLAGRTVDAVQLVISYTKEIFEYISSAFSGWTVSHDEAAGTVTYTSSNPGITEGNEQTFGTLTLKVKDDATVGGVGTVDSTGVTYNLSDSSTKNGTFTSASVTVQNAPIGSISYTLTPNTGKFVVDGTEYASGARYEMSFPDPAVTSAAKRVTFTEVDGYFTPKYVDVVIEAGQNKTPTMTYLTKGKITVTLTPAEAITAGAQWSIDNGSTWKNSGDTISGLDEGTYTVKYKEATDYITPADSSVVIANETGKNTRTVETNYREKGSLTVNLTPNTAKWKLDSDATERASGSSVKVSTGTHTIKFCAVEGYTTPADETVTVDENGKIVSYAYKLQGSLKYTLTPATAQWSIDNGDNWKNSGETIDKLDAGSYTVKFKDATGYFTPANETVAVAVAEAKTATKTYTELGSVQVEIKKIGDKTPYWTLNGTRHNSGDRVENLPAKKYTVSFEEIAGYHKPADIVFEVKATNAPNGNTHSYLNMDYGDAFGYVTVNFTPSGVAGQWSVDGKTWNDGGKKVEIKTGNYTVQFKDVDGFKKPETQTVEVKVGQAVTLEAAYVAKGKIEDENIKPQTEAPTVTEPKNKPASVTSMSGGVLTETEAKAATDNIIIGGTDKIINLPEKAKKVNLMTDCKLIVAHTSSGNETLEFIVTLAQGIELKDGQQLVALLPMKSDKYTHYSFNATYDAATKTAVFTVNNFANFFSEAPVTFAAVDVEGGGSGGSSGGGCNAGFGAILAIFAIPVFFRKRK